MRNIRKLLAMALLAVVACGQRGTDAPPQGDTPQTQAAIELVGTTWQWQEFQDSADGAEARDIHVSDPSKYTLTLHDGDRVELRADCNRVSWTYTLEGSSLRFATVGPSTLAACGDESLDQRFLERLGHTATYVMADGKLYLNLEMDAGNMVFAPAK